ncbi:hypothetical protein C7I55_09920 [Sphingomonas deserti]|uniref:Uncharacterized protein n=2 Tax=Allosphingosinicella deserti TaxID=2116704 RepID=A0A2P7QRP9_9SPHN|nr:hypothetical protein C7I55_09920 [Sphingomonas deserti]
MLFGGAPPALSRTLTLAIGVCGSSDVRALHVPIRDDDPPSGPPDCHAAAAVIAGKKKRA